jgi:hypothetical protein
MNLQLITPKLEKFMVNKQTASIEELYVILEPFFLDVVNNISRYYRSKYPEDHADIVQQVKIDVWKVLPKLLLLVDNSESLCRIAASASILSFKLNYRKHKKHDLIRLPVISYTTELEPFVRVQADELVQSSSVLEEISIKDIPKKLYNQVLLMNRFKEDQHIIKFCLTRYLLGHDPSKKILRSVFKTDKGAFFKSYVKTMIRIATYSLEEIKGDYRP